MIFTISACSNAIPQITSLSSSKKFTESKQSEAPKLVVSEVLGMTAGGHRAQLVMTEREEDTYSAGPYTVESPGVSYE